MNWQPIETAPKDGTVVLGFDPDSHPDLCPYVVMQWRDRVACWMCAGDDPWVGDCVDPIRWAPIDWPLPPPPEVA
jgi:hypothetical protein